MKSLRTPDSRFAGLPDFDFAPNYISDLPGFAGLRVHYLDEGPKDAERTFLCLHGQPTWSYLYRKMIPVFTHSGHRVVVPDLLGFGRSDKPVEDEVYTFSFHRNMLISFIDTLDLKKVTLVCQDWGGILGLTIPQTMEERFERLLIMNTAFPIGETLGGGFDAWKAFNRMNPDLAVGELMKRAVPDLSDKEASAYDAPFPDQTFKAGVRRFPELVMIEPDMPGIDIVKSAIHWWANEWTGLSFMAIGMNDPVLGPDVMFPVKDHISGCPEPMELSMAGHFVQENGEVVAEKALEYFEAQQ